MVYVFSALYNTISFATVIFIIIVVMNYVCIKEFRQLISKIKRVISRPQKAKITLIKNIISDYFFIEE